jgi:hypothetical protein
MNDLLVELERVRSLTEEQRRAEGVDLEALEAHLDCLAMDLMLEDDEGEEDQ